MNPHGVFGDSGGPALYERDGTVFILGISSSNSDQGQGLPECTDHTTNLYARISTHREQYIRIANGAPPR